MQSSFRFDLLHKICESFMLSVWQSIDFIICADWLYEMFEKIVAIR